MSEEKIPHKSGYVAIVGKPNAGKSTLMNHILGTKLSIATHKAQTTRHQIIGIHSQEDSQIIFLDTPGIINPRYELQKAMMRFVEKAEKEAIRRMINFSKNMDEDMAASLAAKKNTDNAELPEVILDYIEELKINQKKLYNLY